MSNESYHMLKFICKDAMCNTVIAITSLETEVECPECGQKFNKDDLEDAEMITKQSDVVWATNQFVKRMMLLNTLPKRGTEQVKVLGLSNFHCKLMSPLLTRYGMDKSTGRAKLLTQMNQGDIFDCSLFRDRAFLIDPMHIQIAGYGRDITGSMIYLSETLKIIKAANDGEERLVPIHTDGDGHCLVHAISRALVGRELFWHPLRCCLKRHFERNLSKYQQLFKDFMQPEDWQAIIEESDPDFKPPEGELHGLRNMHIFGLANVLKRPIILLDSLECMKKCGDYSALFLPGFILPEECRGKDNSLNKPICIAWSSFSHNHYIPLVGVQKKPLPVLPQALIPKVWGMPQSQIDLYIESDKNGNCVIGGNRVLSESYIQRLVHAMEELFMEQNDIHPKLVADAKLYLCSDNAAFLNLKVDIVIERARCAAEEGRLYRCLNCGALSELQVDVTWFQAGGLIYNALISTYDTFDTDTSYRVPLNGLLCTYNPAKNEFVPDLSNTELEKCNYCRSPKVRKVLPNNLIDYLPEDEDFLESIRPSSSQSIKRPEKKSQGSESSKGSLAEANVDSLFIKVSWNGETAQERIPWVEFLELGGNSVQDSVKRFSSEFAAKHFSRVAEDVNFFMYLCDEVWNQVSQHVSEFSTPSPKPEEPSDSEAIGCQETKKEKVSEQDAESIKSEAAAKPSDPEPQFVKVVSNKGQQGNINLGKDGISYNELQVWIAEEFKIPIHHQVIKTGFPPKELEVPTDKVKDRLLLKHGDRLLVENGVSSSSQQKNMINKGTTNKRSSDDHELSSEDIKLLYPKQVELVWKVSVAKPEHFKRGGSIFETAAEKHILTDMLHLTLPYLCTKRLSYNAAKDALELCVKDLGHFPITPDIENRIKLARRGENVPGFSRCPQMAGPSKETVTVRPYRKPITSSPDESYPRVRMGPGFSVLPRPEDSDEMDFS